MEAPAEAAEEVPKEEANCQAGGGGIAVANAVGGDFAMHRRLVLAVAMEVGDRGEGEDFTAGNAAGGGVGRTTAAGGEAGGAVGIGGEEVGRVGKGQSMMFFLIIAFSSLRVRAMALTCSLVLMKGRPMRRVEAELQVICKQ